MQGTLFAREHDPSDVVYTPDWCAKDMLDWFRPCGKMLDPCKGEPDLVRVDRRRGELWAIDCAVGSLQVKMYNDGLTDCMWQEAQLLQ